MPGIFISRSRAAAYPPSGRRVSLSPMSWRDPAVSRSGSGEAAPAMAGQIATMEYARCGLAGRATLVGGEVRPMATRVPAESTRLRATGDRVPWPKWGPYLSERQWGTVREDYSETGNAWDYFSHDQSRSRAYRCGEDGLAGISDDRQPLCLALSVWNGKDPIPKERLFGPFQSP